MNKQSISNYARWHTETSFSHAFSNKASPYANGSWLATRSRTYPHPSSGVTTLSPTSPYHASLRLCRNLHTASASRQVQHAAEQHAPASIQPLLPVSDKVGIRQRLRSWKPEEPTEGNNTDLWLQEKTALDHATKDYMQAGLQVKEEEGFGDDIPDDIFTQEFDRMSGDYEGSDPATAFFRPGDLVELPAGQSGKPHFAVYLRHSESYDLLFDSNGRIVTITFSQVHYKCPSHFTEEELAPILAYLPDDPSITAMGVIKHYSEAVPRNVGAHMLKKLETFSVAVDEAFRTHADALNNLHALVAHSTEARLMSLAEIATKVVGVPQSESHNMPEPLMVAVSYHCIRGPFGFKASNRTYVNTRTLYVESKYSVAAVNRVTRWIRAFQEEASSRIRNIRPTMQTRSEAKPIHLFAKKAARLVKASKDIRIYSPHGAVIGTKAQFLDNPQRAAALVKASFSDTDRDIIHFLVLLVAGKAFMYHPSLTGLPSVLIREIKGNDDFVAMQTEVDAEAVHTLLVEIGVMQPFANPEAIDRELVAHNQVLQEEVDKVQDAINEGVPVEKALELKDSMEHMRRDWGKLPAYCIDPASTVDVDDAISIEDVADSPGHVWVRVHTVHYSSHINPSHFLTRLAENQYQAHYFPEGRWSMMPDYISKKFSIQPDAPVMTVSVRLDAEATLVDYQIEAGIVRNVQTINKDQVDAFLGYNETAVDPLVMSIGNRIAKPSPSFADPDSPPTSGIAPEHHEPLRRLRELARKMISRRPGHHLRQNAFGGQFTLSVSDQPRDPSLPPHYFQAAAYKMHPGPTAPSYALRSPSIAMAINPNFDKGLLGVEIEAAPSGYLVGEFMTLANIVAALYAAERDLPLVFYGTAARAQGIQDQLPMMRQRIGRMARGEEPIERGFLVYTRNAFAVRQLGARPFKHSTMDVECYTKITSPLRKLHDLISQLQLDAALKHEYDTGRSLQVRSIAPSWYGGARKDVAIKLTATDKSFAPPYSEADISDFIARTQTNDIGQMRYVRSHDKHHQFQLFARALYLSPESITPYYPEPTADNPHPSPARPGPDILDPREGRFVAVMGSTGAKRRLCRLEGLEVGCDTEDVVGLQDRRVPVEGERWAVKVDRVKLGMKRIIVRALRRLED